MSKPRPWDVADEILDGRRPTDDATRPPDQQLSQADRVAIAATLRKLRTLIAQSRIALELDADPRRRPDRRLAPDDAARASVAGGAWDVADEMLTRWLLTHRSPNFAQGKAAIEAILGPHRDPLTGEAKVRYPSMSAARRKQYGIADDVLQTPADLDRLAEQANRPSGYVLAQLRIPELPFDEPMYERLLAFFAGRPLVGLPAEPVQEQLPLDLPADDIVSRPPKKERGSVRRPPTRNQLRADDLVIRLRAVYETVGGKGLTMALAGGKANFERTVARFSAIEKYFAGETRPSAATCEKLARFLQQVEPTVFADREDQAAASVTARSNLGWTSGDDDPSGPSSLGL